MTYAFKNLPAKLADLRLQGFYWLQAYFIETQQAFGSSTVVASFDRLGNTILALTVAATGLPPNLVFRTLDNVPLVTPAHLGTGPLFASTHSTICKKINVGLAPTCANCEKAFSDSIMGTVLVIGFDSL